MNTLDSTLYSPSQTWNEYLQKLRWQQDDQPDSIQKAFREAIRRRFSKAEAFCDVAEKIYRSFRPVNWGLLNYTWKQLLSDSGETSGTVVSGPSRNGLLPLPPCNQHNDRPATIHPSRTWNGNQNGRRSYNATNSTKYRQRGGASLVSYYV